MKRNEHISLKMINTCNYPNINNDYELYEQSTKNKTKYKHVTYTYNGI